MSKLIRRSERDIETLQKIQKLGCPASANQPESYAGKVVVKPWGHEFLAFENEHVAVWFLHLQKGHATSMHCHPKKKTALVALSGQVLCNTFYNRNYLNAVDGVIIESGVFHSTQAISNEGANLIEVEAPPDKTDLVRLNDQYGRAGHGYEGLSEMKGDGLERFGYFHFKEPKLGESLSFESGNYRVNLLTADSTSNIEEYLHTKRGEFYCCCRGSVVDSQSNLAIGVGDVVEGAFLQTFEGLKIIGPALFLHFVSREY